MAPMTTTTEGKGIMQFNYTVKYGPTVNGLDCGYTLLVRVYNYDGRFDAGARS